jgi:DHA1 family multidrug resistance protein-like MFS transporter
MNLEVWRKNQLAVTTSAACHHGGFTLVMPFLPLYVRELGIESTAGIAFWTGLLLAISPMIASFAGPVWGRLGDRFGMKLMASRATLANSICWLLMGLSQNVYQLLALRALMGLLGGFNTVSAALVTQLAPREKVPQVIGTLQSVQILSGAVGPFVGGVLAVWVGIRNTFFATGTAAVIAFLSIVFFYTDSHRRIAESDTGTKPVRRSFLKHPQYLTTMLVLFFVHMADRTFGPITPLFLQQLGTPDSRLAAVSGALISAAAFGEAFSAWLSGKLASRIPLRRLIMGRLILSIVVLVPMVFLTSTTQFSVLRVMLALLAGGTLTLALTAGNRIIPDEHRGAGFGILSGTSMLGGAAGPLIAGSLAGLSIRSVFIFNSIVYFLMIGFVYRNVERNR